MPRLLRASPAVPASLLLVAALAGCAGDPPPPPALTDTAGVQDVHSAASTAPFLTDHLALDLTVDFDRKVLEGSATLHLARTGTGNQLVLDTRELVISDVRAGDGDDGALMSVPYTMGEFDTIKGAPLTITVPDDADRVEVAYRTSPSASGLQWLEPRQTAGQRHPFLFSQAQAIHARSFVPLQDTPAIRFTYEATIRVPPGLRAVMSANNTPDLAEDGVYRVEMPQRIPSYLLAIAAGDLEFKAMGKRTGVYAEAELLDAAADEFADTERMLELAEQAYGPYRWGRYDLLILPPSFPFGGMENPRLSFITPTVIAGDRSLVALIAHELAHSWSGNLVTNSNWAHLWMNEGFTTYLTNRIMERVYGSRRYRMEMALGYADLQGSLASMDASITRLVMPTAGGDPDAAFSDIPYEKGALFLYELEQRLGRATFDAFLLDYFDRFAFQSVDTDTFMAHLDSTLLAQYGDVLERDRILEWIYEPGLPEGAPTPRSDAFDRIDAARDEWLSGDTPAADIPTSQWTYHEWKAFLDGMPASLSPEQLTELDETFGLTEATNNEIAFSWLMIAIRNGYADANARLESFLITVGRNKFVRPLYQAMVDADRREEAQRIFEAAKPGYHPLTVKVNGAVVYEDT